MSDIATTLADSCTAEEAREIVLDKLVGMRILNILFGWVHYRQPWFVYLRRVCIAVTTVAFLANWVTNWAHFGECYGASPVGSVIVCLGGACTLFIFYYTNWAFFHRPEAAPWKALRVFVQTSRSRHARKLYLLLWVLVFFMWVVVAEVEGLLNPSQLCSVNPHGGFISAFINLTLLFSQMVSVAALMMVVFVFLAYRALFSDPSLDVKGFLQIHTLLEQTVAFMTPLLIGILAYAYMYFALVVSAFIGKESTISPVAVVHLYFVLMMTTVFLSPAFCTVAVDKFIVEAVKQSVLKSNRAEMSLAAISHRFGVRILGLRIDARLVSNVVLFFITSAAVGASLI